jgi:hypothetical protein
VGSINRSGLYYSHTGTTAEQTLVLVSGQADKTPKSYPLECGSAYTKFATRCCQERNVVITPQSHNLANYTRHLLRVPHEDDVKVIGFTINFLKRDFLIASTIAACEHPRGLIFLRPCKTLCAENSVVKCHEQAGHSGVVKTLISPIVLLPLKLLLTARTILLKAVKDRALDELVFNKDANGVNDYMLRWGFETACKRAGIPLAA